MKLKGPSRKRIPVSHQLDSAAVDINEYFGQQGLVRSSDKPPSGQYAEAEAIGLGHSPDMEAVGNVAASRSEEKDVDDSSYMEPTARKASEWLWQLLDDMQSADHPLESGDRRELAIAACRFSAKDEIDLRASLVDLDESRRHDITAEDMSIYGAEYTRCKELIVNQLHRIYEALVLEEDEEDSKAETAQLFNQTDDTESESGMSSEMSFESDIVDGTEVHSNADSLMLRKLLRLAQSTEDFKPGKIVYNMIEMCDFPPEKDYYVQRILRSLCMTEPTGTRQDDHEKAKLELKKLVIDRLSRRIVDVDEILRHARSAARVQKAIKAENAGEAGAGVDVWMSDDSADTALLENVPIVANHRARGTTFTDSLRAWGSYVIPSTYRRPPPETPITELNPGQLPLIMSLDGPVNIYQVSPTEEERLVEEARQASMMTAFSHGKEVFDLEQTIRAQKIFYDDALAQTPTNRKAMETEIFNKAVNHLRKATVGTILTRCLVAFFLKDYQKMEAHAIEGADMVRKIRDLGGRLCDRITPMQCAYISGVALYYRGEEHYPKAYAAFDKAQGYPGVNKISDKNAEEWKKIVNFRLQGTPFAETIPRPTLSYADSFNPDLTDAWKRSFEASTHVPYNPGPSMPAVPPHRTSRSDRTRIADDNHDNNEPSRPANADQSRNAPTSSQQSGHQRTSTKRGVSSQPRRPVLSPIRVPAERAQAAVPELIQLVPQSRAGPGLRQPATNHVNNNNPIPRSVAGNPRGFGQASVPRISMGSFQDFGGNYISRPRTGSLQSYGDGSRPGSALGSYRRGNLMDNLSFRTAPSSPQSARESPDSLAFEIDIMNNFGGQRGGTGDSTQNSYAAPPQQGQRRRPGTRRMSSESYRRMKQDDWERHVLARSATVDEETTDEVRGNKEAEKETKDIAGEKSDADETGNIETKNSDVDEVEDEAEGTGGKMRDTNKSADSTGEAKNPNDETPLNAQDEICKRTQGVAGNKSPLQQALEREQKRRDERREKGLPEIPDSAGESSPEIERDFQQASKREQQGQEETYAKGMAGNSDLLAGSSALEDEVDNRRAESEELQRRLDEAFAMDDSDEDRERRGQAVDFRGGDVDDSSSNYSEGEEDREGVAWDMVKHTEQAGEGDFKDEGEGGSSKEEGEEKRGESETDQNKDENDSDGKADMLELEANESEDEDHNEGDVEAGEDKADKEEGSEDGGHGKSNMEEGKEEED